jgi:hypothetical protein
MNFAVKKELFTRIIITKTEQLLVYKTLIINNFIDTCNYKIVIELK